MPNIYQSSDYGPNELEFLKEFSFEDVHDFPRMQLYTMAGLERYCRLHEKNMHNFNKTGRYFVILERVDYILAAFLDSMEKYMDDLDIEGFFEKYWISQDYDPSRNGYDDTENMTD